MQNFPTLPVTAVILEPCASAVTAWEGRAAWCSFSICDRSDPGGTATAVGDEPFRRFFETPGFADGRSPGENLRAEADILLPDFFSTRPKHLTCPSRSVANTSGGQQHRQRAKPSSPASVAVAILRSRSNSLRNCPKSDRVRSVAGSFSRAKRSFPNRRVNERRAECRASISMGASSSTFVTMR